MSVPWHCRQIPNGAEPIVVCEREDLHHRISELEAELDTAHDRNVQLVLERDRYRDAIEHEAAVIGSCMFDHDTGICQTHVAPFITNSDRCRWGLIRDCLRAAIAAEEATP